MKIPDDTLKEPMIKFAKSITPNKLYKANDLGKNGEARFKLLEKYQLWLWFEHDIDIVIFTDTIPIESSWNWKEKTHNKYETIKTLRKNEQ